MLRAGFRGPLWPVNPNRETVQGLQAYPSIGDVPDAPDACVIAVAAPLVAETLEACADRGAEAAIILSAGFAEAGERGKLAQNRISEIARERGIRVLGPNTLGVFNAHTGWMGTFASTVLYGTPKPGPVGVASQSGAVGSELFHLLRRRGVQTGMWITTGNEADVDLADAVAYLAGHPGTKVIAVYAEGVRDGPAMQEALVHASAAGKPVLFLKSGRSEVGALAVEAHTAAQAGSDRIYEAVLRQFGAVRVRSAEELVDAAYAATLSSLPAGRRLLILTISGGAGVQMADAAADLDLAVDPPSAEVQKKLQALVPLGAVRNPVDTTAQVFNEIGLIGRCLRTLLEDRDYDAIALFLTSVAASQNVAVPLVAELEQAMSGAPDIPLVLSLAADPELTRPYREAGYPLFEEPTRAVNAVSLLCRLAESRRRMISTPAVEIPPGALRVEGQRLAGDEALRVLGSWGIGCGEATAAASSVEGGVDAVIRATKDPTFGPAVMVGMAGVLAEVLGDVSFRLAPFQTDEALRMIGELEGARLFEAFRGRPVLDVEALAALLSRVSMFAAAEVDALSSVALDPVRVLPAGRGVIVQDAVLAPELVGQGP